MTIAYQTVGLESLLEIVGQTFDDCLEQATEGVYLVANRLGRRGNFLLLGGDNNVSYGTLTPVNTRRAANAWYVSREEEYWIWNTNIHESPAQRPRFQDGTEPLYLTNGAWYIEDLNDGFSAQAPRNFIDLAVIAEFPENNGRFVVDVVDTTPDDEEAVSRSDDPVRLR